jgi:hypothetical protein
VRDVGNTDVRVQRVCFVLLNKYILNICVMPRIMPVAGMFFVFVSITKKEKTDLEGRRREGGC